MRTRRTPLRKCVACQEMMPKKQLIRVVKSPEDEISIDLTGKKSGRGAYLCGKVACFRLVQKNKAFDRALKHTIDDQIYEQLAQDFIKLEKQFTAMNQERVGDE